MSNSQDQAKIIHLDFNSRIANDVTREQLLKAIDTSQIMGPIEQSMQKKLLGLKGTKYPDSFDWGVYDKIAARYGKDQPRGGVVYRTGFKLVNYHTSCSKCHYAFEIDAYGRGCVHNCLYCYAKETLSIHGFWNRPMPFPVDLSEVRKAFYIVFETNKPSRWREILGQRIPIRIGSMSDSFMWMDQKYGVAKELLKILNFYQYPHIIFTRSDLVATDEYLKILDPKLSAIQFSISGENEEITKMLEPGAPSVRRRLNALKTLNESGFWTTIRINPFFPTEPDGFYTDKESILARFGSLEKVPKFRLFSWDFLDQVQDAKVPSILAGVVRLSPKAINVISNVTRIDLKSFYKPDLYAVPGDKKYSDAEIAHYYRKFSSESSKRGIRFNTCYIGNGEKDYFQYQNLWTNKKDCCDALGNVSSFSKTSQSIGWDLRTKLSPMKEMAKVSLASSKEIEEKYITNQVENNRQI